MRNILKYTTYDFLHYKHAYTSTNLKDFGMNYSEYPVSLVKEIFQ